MALTKTVEVDKIEIVGEYKHIQMRTATIVKEDGVELSRSFSRRSITSGYFEIKEMKMGLCYHFHHMHLQEKQTY